MTVHVEPASPGVSVEPDTVHVPSMICHVTAPVPLPPDVVNDKVWPNVAEVDVTDNAACAARAIEIVAADEDSTK